jgi:hypothetical protein
MRVISLFSGQWSVVSGPLVRGQWSVVSCCTWCVVLSA